MVFESRTRLSTALSKRRVNRMSSFQPLRTSDGSNRAAHPSRLFNSASRAGELQHSLRSWPEAAAGLPRLCAKSYQISPLRAALEAGRVPGTSFRCSPKSPCALPIRRQPEPALQEDRLDVNVRFPPIADIGSIADTSLNGGCHWRSKADEAAEGSTSASTEG